MPKCMHMGMSICLKGRAPRMSKRRSRARPLARAHAQGDGAYIHMHAHMHMHTSHEQEATTVDVRGRLLSTPISPKISPTEISPTSSVTFFPSDIVTVRFTSHPPRVRR